MKNSNQRWINVLTEGRVDKQQQFEEILSEAPCEVLAIMSYRRLEKNRGRGQHITVEHLKYGNRCKEGYLIEVLEELFLEPITMRHIEYFYKTASKKYDNMMDAMEELYDRAMQDTGTRFLTIALTI